MDLILDVKEKDIGEVKAPSLPTHSTTKTGFPEHKKRNRPSAFKQQRQSAANSPAVENKSLQFQGPLAPKNGGAEEDERRRIDQENKARIQDMSPAEIEDAQRELLNGLDPSILQMLLKRANLDDTVASKANESVFMDEPGQSEPPMIRVEDTTAVSPPPQDSSSADIPRKTAPKSVKKVTFDEDSAPAKPPADLFPLDSQAPSLKPTHSHDHDHSHSTGTTHFPAAPAGPDLDPSDPDFLANLHQKYFPQLPADPAKLAWMAPIPTPNSAADQESPYYPGQSSLPVSALRFDFQGRLVPPRLARQIPSSAGLHHHAEAPEAAGYTVPELAKLARSAVPAQRCLAFQMLGRMMYRLGKGEWGVGEGGRGGEEDDLAFALWRLFRAGRVIETLEEAAGVEEGVGHRGVRAYAIEALWLSEKGGWKEKWRGM